MPTVSSFRRTSDGFPTLPVDETSAQKEETEPQCQMWDPAKRAGFFVYRDYAETKEEFGFRTQIYVKGFSNIYPFKFTKPTGATVKDAIIFKPRGNDDGFLIANKGSRTEGSLVRVCIIAGVPPKKGVQEKPGKLIVVRNNGREYEQVFAFDKDGEVTPLGQ